MTLSRNAFAQLTAQLHEGSITGEGLSALEPYKVTNAVVMAAGLSQRFAPLSYERPKGLLKVRGEILIERQIRQLLDAGISDITVVVGYKKEHFLYLESEFGVRIVANPEYATRNNNSSLWVVREHLANTYICCADNYFLDNPFEPYVFEAFYSTPYVEGPTDEWCVSTGEDGRIVDISIGGSDSLVMVGPAYFDRRFSTAFRRLLAEVYDLPETTDKYWENIYLDNIADMHMVARRFPDGMINEFDSLDDVRDFDPAFIRNVDSQAFDRIVATLGCSREDIHDLSPIKQGLTNLSCHFAVGTKEYVYRHPGEGTNKVIDRQAELLAQQLASRLGLDHTFIHGDPEDGWKISRFISNARDLDVASAHELESAMRIDRTLHESGEIMERRFDFISQGLTYEALLNEQGPIDIPGYAELKDKVLRLKDFADDDGYAPVPSHNDFYTANFLVTSQAPPSLIDWEYAGMSDIASDFGALVASAELTDEQAEQAIQFYFGRQPSVAERRHFWAYAVIAGWCWYLWALVAQSQGDDVDEWRERYYHRAADYVDSVLSWYEAPPQ